MPLDAWKNKFFKRLNLINLKQSRHFKQKSMLFEFFLSFLKIANKTIISYIFKYRYFLYFRKHRDT